LGALQIKATTSDLGAWQDLTHGAETAFDLARYAGALVVPTWLVHVLNVVADVGPSLSAVIVAAASGRLGLLVARLGRWRVGGRWYLPLVLVGDAPLVQAAVLLLFIAPLTFPYAWVFNGTGGSVLLHGAQNGISAFLERRLLPALSNADA